jgi:DNA-binding MarR family transcriptional regulator
MTDIDKATAAKGLARLERIGYVRRQPAPRDRRVRQLFLTEAGQAVMPHIKATLRHVTEVCAEDLTAAELDELFRLLGKVEASLDRYIESAS